MQTLIIEIQIKTMFTAFQLEKLMFLQLIGLGLLQLIRAWEFEINQTLI